MEGLPLGCGGGTEHKIFLVLYAEGLILQDGRVASWMRAGIEQLENHKIFLVLAAEGLV